MPPAPTIPSSTLSRLSRSAQDEVTRALAMGASGTIAIPRTEPGLVAGEASVLDDGGLEGERGFVHRRVRSPLLELFGDDPELLGIDRAVGRVGDDQVDERERLDHRGPREPERARGLVDELLLGEVEAAVGERDLAEIGDDPRARVRLERGRQRGPAVAQLRRSGARRSVI